MCGGEDTTPPRRVFTPLISRPPLKSHPNGHDPLEGSAENAYLSRQISAKWHGNCSIYRQETDLVGEDTQMKKALITVAMVAMAVFMAVSVSWGATPDTATWETATWETIAPGTIW